jgi:lipopolysaccharide/colanic/teichoic acid biosynthesis glycosyltransferase
VLDAEYLRRRSAPFDFRIVWLTVLKVSRGSGVAH